MRILIPIVFSFAFMFLTACEKEREPSLFIESIETEIIALNNSEFCPDEDEAHGTRIHVNMIIRSYRTNINKLEIKYLDSNQRGGILTKEVNNQSITSEGILTYGACFWFDNREFFDETYRLMGTTDEGLEIESNEVKIKILKPEEAN